MSQIGGCPKNIVAAQLGFEESPAPEYLGLAAQEGQLHEKAILAELQEKGYDPRDFQKEVRLEFPAAILIGHIDATVKMDGRRRLLEIKALGRFQFQKFISKGIVAFPEYAYQLSSYMFALGDEYLPALFWVKCRDSGKQTCIEFPEPPLQKDAIERRIELIANHVERKELPFIEYDEEKCRWCLRKYLCSPHEDSKQIDDLSLRQAANLYREGRQLTKIGQAYIDEAREIFRRKAIITPNYQVDNIRVLLYKQHREIVDKNILIQIFGAERIAPAIKKQEVETLRVIDLLEE